MLWLLFFIQDFVPILICALFFGYKDYILGFSLLNISYIVIQALAIQYIPQYKLFQSRLLGLGLSALLLFFIPKGLLDLFAILVSLTGISNENQKIDNY